MDEFEVLGITESKGNYQGSDYHNFNFHCCKPGDPTKDYGQRVEVIKVKAAVFDTVLGLVGGDPADLIGRKIEALYNRFGNVFGVNLV